MSVTRYEQQRFVTKLKQRKRELIKELRSLPEQATMKRRVTSDAIAKVIERIKTLERNGVKP